MSYLQNVVCTVTCGFEISLNDFNNLYGGQFTDNLPAVRKHCYIFNPKTGRKDLRYGYIVYSTGMIVITNIIDGNHLAVFKYFASLILSMIKNGVTTVKSQNLSVKFLMENFSFAFCIDPDRFKEKYLSGTIGICNHPENLKIEIGSLGLRCFECARYFFYNKIYNQLAIKFGDKNISATHKSLMLAGERTVSFPADHLEIIFRRSPSEDQTLIENKSVAARKRKINSNTKDLSSDTTDLLIFGRQRVSVHVFSSGKFIITGAQTNQDLERIILVISNIFDYFL
jgi:hypothetical protein